MRKPGGRVERYVRGRNAERAPKPLARDDMAQHRIAAPEAARRGFDVASFERAPDRRRRNHVGLLSGAVFDLGDDIDGEAVPGPRVGEKGRRSGASLAEMEIPSNHNCAGGEPPDEEPGDKLFRGQRRERRIEGEGDDPRNPEALAKSRLHPRRRQAKSDRAVGKIVGRVRLEREERVRRPALPRQRSRPRDDRLMPRCKPSKFPIA